MSAVVGALKEARSLISEKKHWTRGASAKNASGQKTWSDDPEAVCWCMLGAIVKVATGLDCAVEVGALNALRIVCHSGIPQFNDDPATTHEMVLHKFDLAIVEAGQMEKTC